MEVIDLLYLVNVGCMAVSGWFALKCFSKGNTVIGWLNVFASSLNLAIVANHFL